MLFVSYAAGADYINDTMSYSWPASEAQQCYPFRPVNDAIVESTEQLRLILTSTSPRVMVAPAISTVMITDEDSEYAYTGTHTHMHARTHACTHACTRAQITILHTYIHLDAVNILKVAYSFW